MSYVVLSAPGTPHGPCATDCEHTDCNITRQDAARRCPFCGQTIGYGTRITMVMPGHQYAGNFAHWTCLCEDVERSNTAPDPDAHTHQELTGGPRTRELQAYADSMLGAGQMAIHYRKLSGWWVGKNKLGTTYDEALAAIDHVRHQLTLAEREMQLPILQALADEMLGEGILLIRRKADGWWVGDNPLAHSFEDAQKAIHYVAHELAKGDDLGPIAL